MPVESLSHPGLPRCIGRAMLHLGLREPTELARMGHAARGISHGESPALHGKRRRRERRRGLVLVHGQVEGSGHPEECNLALCVLSFLMPVR